MNNCKSCVFFHKMEDKKETGEGSCKRTPPSIVTVTGAEDVPSNARFITDQVIQLQPVVAPTDTCGEYKEADLAAAM